MYNLQKSDVGKKLYKIKKIIQDISKMQLAKRKENEEAIDRLQYTQENMRDEINSLTPENYYKGPEVDEDGSRGEIWIFGKEIKGEIFYIKIKIQLQENGDELIILSFHPARYKMTFKFKK